MSSIYSAVLGVCVRTYGPQFDLGLQNHGELSESPKPQMSERHHRQQQHVITVFFVVVFDLSSITAMICIITGSITTMDGNLNLTAISAS